MAHLLTSAIDAAPPMPAASKEPLNCKKMIGRWDSRPQTVTDWPLVSEVVFALRGQLPRLTAAITALSPRQLNQVLGLPHDETLRYVVTHGLHDEANHQGEIWPLRKMYAKGVRD